MRTLYSHRWVGLVLFLLLPFSLKGQQTSAVLETVFTDLPAKDYPISKGAELPFHHAQTRIAEGGYAEYEVRLEYPEFVALTSAEAAAVKASAYAVPDTLPRVETVVSTSRGETWVEYRFCPIVKCSGRLMRLVSCKVSLSPRAVPARTNAKNTPAERYAPHSVLAQGRWVKICVEQEGIYQLTDKQLAEMGFADPSKVKLYGYGGRIQEENLCFTGTGAVTDDLQEVPTYRRSGSMLFFAEGTLRWTWSTSERKWKHQQNVYSDYSYYFLTEGDAPLQMATLPQLAATAEPVSQVRYHAVLDDDHFSWYAGGREFYDDYDFQNGNSHTFSLAAPGAVDGESATIDVAFSAAHATSTTRAEISLNNNKLGSFSIPRITDREDARETRTTYKSTDLKNDNAFKLAATSGHSARLNFIRINYQRSLNAGETGYSFSPQGTERTTLQIASADKDTRLWRIGTANHPTAEVYPELNGNVLTATTDTPSERFVIVNVAGTYPSPQVVGEVANQDLHADAALDMVIIVPANGKLTAEAERLAEEHRNRQGLRVKVVAANHIYNEFSSGTPDATAYRRYLKMLYDKAETTADMPRYLLLFGDCIWDNRLITGIKGYTQDDFLLAYERNSSESSIGTITCYVTDDYFGLLADGKGQSITTEKVDLGIGRFTCTTPEEAKIYVDKTIAYMENAQVGIWKNTVCMLGDDGDNNEHMEDAENVAKEIQNVSHNDLIIKKTYWDASPRTITATGTSYPLVSKQLKEFISKGSAIMYNYSGHGSPDQISHSKLLLTNDFKAATTNMALWVFASCEITPYDTRTDNIGRSAMLNNQGGAIALMCASRAVYANENNNLNKAFCKAVFDNDENGIPNTLGDAMRISKVNMLTMSQGDRTMNKLKYALIGDPALTLTYPTGEVILDSINGELLSPEVKKQLKAGSVARFSGHIAAKGGGTDASFNGILTAVIADRMETVVCKKNDSRTETPMTYSERTNMIYEGSDSVRSGKFTLNILIPNDISYTEDAGRITFYAVNHDHSKEAKGHNEQFFLNGTDANAAVDTIAPKVYLYLDNPDFPNGGFTGTQPMFVATISDNIGINASGTNVGHDMELVIDNQQANVLTLNDYFNYDFGSYNSGVVSYPLQGLAVGKHKLSFRVWDVNNNSTTSVLDFTVQEDINQALDVNATSNPARTSTHIITSFAESEEAHTVSTEIYDIAGRKIWAHQASTNGGSGYSSTEWRLTDGSGAPVPAGIYLYRAVVSSPSQRMETKTKKIIVVRQ